MKKVAALFLWILLLTANSCGTGEPQDSGTFVAGADYVQVVLFHLQQRCESCNAVEKETKRLLGEEYNEATDSGRLKFISLNIQAENGKKAAALLHASGQSLFVVKGDSVSDLTGSAFVYAGTLPENYRKALRTALDKYLE